MARIATSSTAIPVVAAAQNSVVQYGEVASVAIGFETSLVSYTAPVGKTTYLINALASGENRGYFNLYNNGVLVDKQYTNVTQLSGEFDYKTSVESAPGMLVAAGDVIELTAVNAGEDVVSFNARLLILVVG